MTKAPQQTSAEQRKYIRLNSVFPVEFILYSERRKETSLWFQGYTCNVSRGGICLETIGLDDATASAINKSGSSLELRIHIPIGRPPVKAVAQVMWFKPDHERGAGHHVIGLKFDAILASDLSDLLKRARWIRFSSQTAVIASVVLFFALIGITFYSFQLRRTNEKMIETFVNLQQEEINAQDNLSHVMTEKENTLQQMEATEEGIPGKKELKNKYEEILAKENDIADRLSILERQKKGLQETILNKMKLWLKNHQHPETGLVLSFEGHDGVVQDWAFTYDQALAAIVFLNFGEEHKARKILNFFNKLSEDDFQGYDNAYYYDSGEPSEFTIHTGPNIWLGLAIIHYTQKTNDTYYMPLARRIADWVISLQDKDPEGGIKGGPDVTWFATEHNLDAYAFFSMMYDVTDEEKYDLAKKKTLAWLQTYSLIPEGKDYQSPPINRGRGDSTIATDTFAWALASIGPEKLKEIGMDPEQILNFAEEHCAVTVRYKRPSGAVVEVKGFDFAKTAHLPRGGMVSPEWTSQMIVSYEILSDYFAKKDEVTKAGFYREKANNYLNELNKLIISSPSAKGQGEGCLPYATLEDTETGHGWSTPHGTSTCSIAGTAYMIMAINKWNPLNLD